MAYDITETDISSALFYSHIDPMLVNRICAFWRAGEWDEGRIGIILESNGPIRHAYVVHHWNHKDGLISTSTQKFREYPDFLYTRAVNWVNDVKTIEKLNGRLGYAKANAKYGPPARTQDQVDETELGWSAT